MVEKCSRCQITSDKVRLFDVIYEGKMDFLCERCAIIEDIPVFQKPDAAQVKESEKSTEVYERMKKLSGYKEPGSDNASFRAQRLKELETNPKLEKPIKEQLQLIEHFHWEIMKNRRRKGLTQKQLADAIGEQELAIAMLEKGKLPEGSENLIRKLEQFFQESLRKITLPEAMALRKQKLVRTKPVLLDEDGNELESIPEPETPLYLESREVEEKKEIPWYKKILGKKKNKVISDMASSDSDESEDSMIAEKYMPSSDSAKSDDSKFAGSRYLEYRRRENIRSGRVEPLSEPEEPKFELKENEDLDLNKVDINKVRINDLKEVHRKRAALATKEEKIEEQRKIESKERLVEARKEELRAMKEKESKYIDEVLGGKELLGKKDDFSKSVEDFDEDF